LGQQGLRPGPGPVFLFFIFYFFGLGLAQPEHAGLGPASLAWSPTQASDQPRHCACIRELLTHALHSDRVIILQAGKNKRSLPGVAGGEGGTWGWRQWWSWRFNATPLFSSFSILLSIFSLLFVFFCVFCVCISVRVLPVQCFLYSFSSPVRPCISLLECPIAGAVTAEDGALELLLKTRYNGLTLCFPLLFFFFSVLLPFLLPVFSTPPPLLCSSLAFIAR